MTTLIKPDGSFHFIDAGERERIAQLIADGARIQGAPLPEAAIVEEVDAPIVNDAPDVSTMTVAAIREWLETSPAIVDAIDAFAAEQNGKHRTTALDVLQDYIGDTDG